MSFQEVQTLESFCRLLFEVTLHESSFGCAASMQSNPEVKGPPISPLWRNAHSVSVPIHRPACLPGLASGQGLWLGIGGSGRVPKSRDVGNEVWLPWVAEGPKASRSRGGLLLRESWALIHHSTPQPCPRTINSHNPRGQAWWEERLAVGWAHVAHSGDSDSDNDGGTMWQQAAVWEVTVGWGERLRFEGVC